MFMKVFTLSIPTIAELFTGARVWARVDLNPENSTRFNTTLAQNAK